MFHPYEQLAEDLLANIPSDNSDGSHDLSHLMRVWANVRTIQKEEGGDLEILAASCVLHDCVSVEKNSPDRSAASKAAGMDPKAMLDGHDAYTFFRTLGDLITTGPTRTNVNDFRAIWTG